MKLEVPMISKKLAVEEKRMLQMRDRNINLPSFNILDSVSVQMYEKKLKKHHFRSI